MYKIITINGNEYKLEYTIEASLYNDCIERVVTLMYGIDQGQNNKDVKQILSGVSDLPNTAMSCFYAGLLEHHGVESGDGSVPNLARAKKLAAVFLRDEESEAHNWYDLLTLCMNQMGEDGFFELVGLNSFLTTEAPKTQRRPRKVPQDHKTKSKATEE